MDTVYRHFPCDGLCGTYIDIPAKIARELMKPNGTILPHEPIFCECCRWWWTLTIDHDITPPQ